MTTIWTLAACIGLVTVLGAFEAWRLRRSLRGVGIRIHVNGTRGKSSVTRLIAAGLRSAGIRTVAKTTGTLPRLILPDGSELPIQRKARANVIEQRDVASAAAAAGAEALVVECMALQPQLQSLCESKLVRATHGVITNCRADHLDIMGPSEQDVACALANTTPMGGKVFTAERRRLDILQRAAADRNSQLIAVTLDDVEDVSDFEMAGFCFDEHRENVALALRVCADFGIDRLTALAGMHQAQPDPGATSSHVVEFHGRQMNFVNAFAANDPDSTLSAWQRALADCPPSSSRIALVNCRSDRPDRSVQLARAMVDWPPADHVVLAGSGTALFVRAGRRAGLDMRRVTAAENCDPAELFELILDLAGPAAVVVGMGNIGEGGLEITRYFRNRSRLAAPAKVRVDLSDRLTGPVNGTVNGSVNGKHNGHVMEIIGEANGTKVADQLFATNGNES